MHEPTCIFWANLTPLSLKAYQASENCKLELKFARQLGVPIVPALYRRGRTVIRHYYVLLL